MLFAPVTMVVARPHPPAADQAASHCAAQGDTDQRAPIKHVHCMGACSGVEVAMARLTAPMALPLAAAPILTESLLDEMLIERDTPPPRLS